MVTKAASPNKAVMLLSHATAILRDPCGMTRYGETGCGKSCGKLGSSEENMWRMMKNLTECSRNAVMLDGEISNYVDIFGEQWLRNA